MNGPDRIAEIVNEAIDGAARSPLAASPEPAHDSAAAKTRARPKKSARGRNDALATTEDALATTFVDRHGQALRRSPGLEWMLDRGDHWTRDEQLKRYDWARTIAREAARAADDDKIATRLGSAKTVGGIVSLAQSDPRIALPADVWDADPMVLNTPGGVLDLRTGKTRSRDGEYHTQIARVAPDAQASCKLWERFLADVFLGDLEMVEFVQRLLGYVLTGDRREQKLFFLYGLGANGKSTLADVVQWILGSYSVKLPATTLTQSSIGQHPTELAQLRGKRLAMSSEIDEGLYWAESRIKELTGDETLTARFMRQDFFEFRMTQKHVIVGNYKPRMRGGDAALARRFVLVPFNAKFQGAQRDSRMLDKLRAEAPAILAWMVQGAIKWADSGLAIPSSVTAASAEYMSDNDDVVLWLDECCIRSVNVEARGGDLYESFASWIKARGQHAPSMRVWADRMNVVPGVVKRRSGGIRYAGVRLTTEEASRLAAPVGGWAR